LSKSDANSAYLKPIQTQEPGVRFKAVRTGPGSPPKNDNGTTTETWNGCYGMRDMSN